MDELTVSTAAQNGDIFVTETHGLSNLSLSAGTGNVTLTLNDGSVVDTDGSEDISAKSANVTVSNGAFGTNSNSITTNVDVLSVDTTGANGDQFIKEVSGLTGLNLNAKNGNITLEVGGAVTDDETDADITANVATITANGDFGGANAINTAVSTLSVATGPSAGNINVKEADDVTLSKLSTANGSISFTADGNITVPNSGNGVVAGGVGSITMLANGTDSSFTANQEIKTSGGQVSITGTKNVTLQANGDISSSGGNVSVTATTGNVSFDANTTLTAGAGQVSITGNGDVTITGISTTNDTTSAVSITSQNGSIKDAGDVVSDITATSANAVVTLSAKNEIDGIETDVTSLTATATDGNIVITEANGLSGLNLSAANGSVTLTVTTGSVSDLDNATDITAKSTTVTVSNGSFGTNANAIATSVDELTVSTAAQNGDIFVTEANGLSNLSLSAGTGNVTLTVTTGSVVDLDNATDISAKSANVTVSNGSFGTSANAIVTSVDELTVSTASQNGDIFVTETNGLSNLSLSAGTGNVTLTLNDGSVVDTDGSEDISAKSANVTVSNGAFGTGSNSITTNVDVLLVDTTGANGDQFIKEVSGLTGLNLNAKNGNITLTAGGSIVDTDSDLDITANVATITANGDVGTANAINTSVGTLK